MKRLVIERPDLQSPLQRTTTGGLTFIFWLFWIYLWLPLISLAAWWVGISLFRDNLIENSGYQLLFTQLSWYVFVISLIAFLLIGWARYNLLRFRDKERRKKPMPVDLITHARDFKVDAARLVSWQNARHLVIHHDEHGVITHVETGNNFVKTNPAKLAPAPGGDIA